MAVELKTLIIEGLNSNRQSWSFFMLLINGNFVKNSLEVFTLYEWENSKFVYEQYKLMKAYN